MPSPYGPGSTWGPTGARRRTAGPDPRLRVSDADRAHVADQLSKHYGDGRLDEAEFNERLEKAMNAKTQADLGGLLDDLPAEHPPADVVRRRPRRPFHPVLFVFLIVALVAVTGHLLFHPFAFFLPVPWLLAGLLVLLLLRRRGAWRYRGGQGPR